MRFRRDAHAAVAYLDAYLVTALAAGDQNAAAGRIADGIAHEVGDDALEQHRVGVRPAACRARLQAQFALFGRRPLLGGNAFENGLKRKRPRIGMEHAGVELGDVEQTVEQVVHGLCGSGNALHETPALGRMCVLRKLRHEQAQCVHRLTQVVTGRSQKA